jgi:hypothetical protein
MARLRALVGRERRIEMSALRLANQTEDDAVPKVLLPLQGRGKIKQETIAAGLRQRTTCGDDGIELTIAQFDWRHAADSAAGFRLTADRDSRQRAVVGFHQRRCGGS